MIAVAHRVHVCAANHATCAGGSNNTLFLYFMTKNRLDRFGLQVLAATCAAFISESDNKETLHLFEKPVEVTGTNAGLTEYVWQYNVLSLSAEAVSDALSVKLWLKSSSDRKETLMTE